MDVIEELAFLVKNHIKKFRGGGRFGEFGLGGGGQSGCERRIEVFVKIKKNIIFFFLGGGGGGSAMDVNEELKIL